MTLGENGDNNVATLPIDVGRLSGGLGRYQLMLVLMVFLRSFPSSWTLTGLEFIAGDVDHWCAPPNDEWSIEYWKREGIPEGGRCHRFVVNADNSINKSLIERCDHWVFNSSALSSSVSEFGLVCDRSWQKSAIQSVVFIAQIAGALITGSLSDRYGRLPSYTWSTTLFIIFGIGASFAPSVMILNVLRFVQCVAIAGLNTSISTFYTETSRSEHRSLLNVGFALGFQIPMLFFPSLANVLNNWRGVQAAMGLSAIVLLPFFCFLQESPRWLLMNGEPAKARVALEKILLFNKKSLATLNNVHFAPARPVKCQPITRRFADLMRNPSLRKTVLALFSLWFMAQAAFFSTIFLSTRIPGDKSRNFSFTAAAGVVGGATVIFLLRFAPRRMSVASSLIISSFALIVLAALPKDSAEWMYLAAAMLLRSSIVVSVGIVWTYTLEIFPTVVRNFGFSCCFCCGRIGGVIAPFMRDLGEWNEMLPYLFLAVACFGASLVLPFLPETLNKPLPDDLKDAQGLNENVTKQNKQHVVDNKSSQTVSLASTPLIKPQ